MITTCLFGARLLLLSCLKASRYSPHAKQLPIPFATLLSSFPSFKIQGTSIIFESAHANSFVSSMYEIPIDLSASSTFVVLYFATNSYRLPNCLVDCIGFHHSCDTQTLSCAFLSIILVDGKSPNMCFGGDC